MKNILHDIHVVSLAANIPGPVAAARLRDMGAAVVKVEPPSGDALAMASPQWYAELHDGVQLLRLDLKSNSGRKKLEGLLAESDLLLTASRPSSLKRLGLAWPTLADRYPDLCQVAISGYAPPDADMPGHDLTYQASVGLLKPPDLPRTLVADMAGAERAVTAALALLYNRERAKRAGTVLEEEERFAWAPISVAAEDFAEPLRRGLTAPGELLGGMLPMYNLYKAADGWIAIAAIERHFLATLALELKLEQVTKEAVAEAFLARGSAEWEEWALARDIPLVAVREAV
jgi:crotonobetainyl-CoA:carnitine CoA-transferase CaiB-like acyl-CoA transferase